MRNWQGKETWALGVQWVRSLSRIWAWGNKLKKQQGLLLDFPGGSDGKESASNVGYVGLIPGWGRFPGGKNGNPLQYSCLESPWTEEPGGLQPMGSQRVRVDWATDTWTFRVCLQRLPWPQVLCLWWDEHLSISRCREGTFSMRDLVPAFSETDTSVSDCPFQWPSIT